MAMCYAWALGLVHIEGQTVWWADDLDKLPLESNAYSFLTLGRGIVAVTLGTGACCERGAGA